MKFVRKCCKSCYAWRAAAAATRHVLKRTSVPCCHVPTPKSIKTSQSWTLTGISLHRYQLCPTKSTRSELKPLSTPLSSCCCFFLVRDWFRWLTLAKRWRQFKLVTNHFRSCIDFGCVLSCWGATDLMMYFTWCVHVIIVYGYTLVLFYFEFILNFPLVVILSFLFYCCLCELRSWFNVTCWQDDRAFWATFKNRLLKLWASDLHNVNHCTRCNLRDTFEAHTAFRSNVLTETLQQVIDHSSWYAAVAAWELCHQQ